MRKALHILPLVGKNKDTGNFERVNNVLCIRKGVELSHIKKYLKLYKMDRKETKFFTFVSSPYLIKNDLVKDVSRIWLHPWRDPDRYLPSSIKKYCVSESDFVDPVMFSNTKKSKKIWDYCYFTVGGDDGVNHKGYKVFSRLLPTLSKYKGHVIIYGKFHKFPKQEVKRIKSMGIKVSTKCLDSSQVEDVIRKSKFGFFPNIEDCSPRMIPECIIQNVPVLVNNDIWGGWKYVNDHTGRIFDIKGFKEHIKHMLDGDFSPRDNFMNLYGMKNSSEKLSTILSEHFEEAKNYSNIYFETHKTYMKRALK